MLYKICTLNSNGENIVDVEIRANECELKFDECMKVHTILMFRKEETKPFYTLVVPATHTLSIYKTTEEN